MSWNRKTHLMSTHCSTVLWRVVKSHLLRYLILTIGFACSADNIALDIETLKQIFDDWSTHFKTKGCFSPSTMQNGTRDKLRSILLGESPNLTVITSRKPPSRRKDCTLGQNVRGGCVNCLIIKQRKQTLTFK